MKTKTKKAVAILAVVFFPITIVAAIIYYLSFLAYTSYRIIFEDVFGGTWDE